MKNILIIFSCLMALNCSSQKNEDPKLIGKWDGMLKDLETTNTMGKIVLEFTKDGKFIQYVGEGKMQNSLESTYTVKNHKIIAIDKATNEKDETDYVIKTDTLTIIYQGIENKYVKRK